MARNLSSIKNGRRLLRSAAYLGASLSGANVNATKLAILITLLSILVKGKIHYCEPHPDTTIALLQQFHDIDIGRRWFFQCMADLEDAGLIRRQRRWKILPINQIRSKSSLWWFTIRGAKFLVSKSIRGAQELLKSMLTWLHRGDDRRPTTRDLVDAVETVDQADALKRISALIRDVGLRPAGGHGPAAT